jgi:hypothetical protein
MRKKVTGIVLGIMFLVFLVIFSAGANINENAVKEDAMKCLYDKVGAATSLNLRQAIFCGLANVPSSKMNDTINGNKKSDAYCWPKEGCDVKTTAQVYLAKQRMGEDTQGIIDWLMNQTGAIQGLTWYLQISMDDNGPGKCFVNYEKNGANYEVDIGSDMKLSAPSSLGSCLVIDSASRDRLTIQSQCLNNEFFVQCNRTWKTNLLYRQDSSGVLFISPEIFVESDTSLWTSHKIGAKCFINNGACDYEGSLWATLVLYSSGKETSEFIPYLDILSSANQKYFPEAFLNLLVKDRTTSVMGKRTNLPGIGNYWKISGSPYGDFYDTSLAMLSLDGVSGVGTLGYLKDRQDSGGCWNGGNIADTAFVIYGSKWSNGWTIKRSCSELGGGCYDSCAEDETQSDGTCDESGKVCCVGGDNGGPIIPPGSACEDVNGTCNLNCTQNQISIEASCDGAGELCCYNISTNGNPPDGRPTYTDCELGGFHCFPNDFSCLDASGEIKPRDQYYCNTLAEACCTAEPTETLKNCFELGGSVCSADEQCSDSTVQASDGSCCQGSCEAIGGGTPGCTSNSECSSGRECKNGTCSIIVVESGSSSWLWIVLLIILIIIVVIGIIFRDKIKVWWFKTRGKPKTSKLGPSGPPGFGGPPGTPMMRREAPRFVPGPRPGGMPPMRPVARAPPVRPARASSPKDKEMDETLKKLRDMSK